MKIIYALAIGCILISACRQSPKEQKINSPLNYSLVGQGGRTLVFVHGWCINKSYWDSQIDAFKDTYKVLTLDLAGHGKSKVYRTDWSLANYANDIVDLIRQLNLDSVILIGHSMSGNINLLVNDRIPEKIIGFIGVDNLHELGKELSDTAKAEWKAFNKSLENNYTGTAPRFANFLFSSTTDSLVRIRVMDNIMHADSQMAAATIKSLYEASLNEKTYSKKLHVPLLLINSDVNPVNEGLLKQNCGNGYKIFYVHGTGHYPMIEAPQEFNMRLQEALNIIRSSAKK